MTHFRKKPVVISAEQYTDEYSPKGVCNCRAAERPHVHTAHARQVVVLAIGDWIVPEPNGQGHYPISNDIMEQTYDRLD